MADWHVAKIQFNPLAYYRFRVHGTLESGEAFRWEVRELNERYDLTQASPLDPTDEATRAFLEMVQE